MQIPIQPEAKLKKVSVDKSNYKINETSNNAKYSLDIKLYQKLFVILLTLCGFLIFPESPQNAQVLCNKYHLKEACIVW